MHFSLHALQRSYIRRAHEARVRFVRLPCDSPSSPMAAREEKQFRLREAGARVEMFSAACQSGGERMERSARASHPVDAIVGRHPIERIRTLDAEGSMTQSVIPRFKVGDKVRFNA